MVLQLGTLIINGNSVGTKQTFILSNTIVTFIIVGEIVKKHFLFESSSHKRHVEVHSNSNPNSTIIYFIRQIFENA